MCIFPHYSTAYSAQRKSLREPRGYPVQAEILTHKGYFSSGVPSLILASLIYMYASVFSWNRWGPHSQMYYLRSSYFLPVYSLYPLVLLISLSHHITICLPCKVNICFYFYPSVSLKPINVLSLLVKPVIPLHLSWKGQHTVCSSILSYPLLIRCLWKDALSVLCAPKLCPSPLVKVIMLPPSPPSFSLCLGLSHCVAFT